MQFNAIALLKSDAPQGRGFHRVTAMLLRGWEKDFHLTEPGFQNYPEPEFGLTITDPALTWNWLIDWH
jgi:hypothetical protein